MEVDLAVDGMPRNRNARIALVNHQQDVLCESLFIGHVLGMDARSLESCLLRPSVGEGFYKTHFLLHESFSLD